MNKRTTWKHHTLYNNCLRCKHY